MQMSKSYLITLLNYVGQFKKRTADSVWDLKTTENQKMTVSAWSENITMTGVEDTIRFVKFIEKTHSQHNLNLLV